MGRDVRSGLTQSLLGEPPPERDQVCHPCYLVREPQLYTYNIFQRCVHGLAGGGAQLFKTSTARLLHHATKRSTASSTTSASSSSDTRVDGLGEKLLMSCSARCITTSEWLATLLHPAHMLTMVLLQASLSRNDEARSEDAQTRAAAHAASRPVSGLPLSCTRPIC
jgi:hypothetical protein